MKDYLIKCVTKPVHSKDSDQPGYCQSQIKAFAMHSRCSSFLMQIANTLINWADADGTSMQRVKLFLGVFVLMLYVQGNTLTVRMISCIPGLNKN